MSGGETCWSKNVQIQKNVRGEGGKRPGPKRLSPKSPDAKTLPEHSLHDCESSSMVVTFPEASL